MTNSPKELLTTKKDKTQYKMKRRRRYPKNAILQNKYVIGALALGLVASLVYHFIAWLLL